MRVGKLRERFLLVDGHAEEGSTQLPSLPVEQKQRFCCHRKAADLC